MKNEDFMSVSCPHCGRRFVPAIEHVFKIGKKYYCCWSCFYAVKYKKVKEPAVKHTKPGKPRRPVLQYDLNGGYIQRFVSMDAAARSVGVSPTAMRAACKKSGATSRGYVWKYETERTST